MAVAWWLALGYLGNGSFAGLWILNANNGLGNANWNIVSGFSFMYIFLFAPYFVPKNGTAHLWARGTYSRNLIVAKPRSSERAGGVGLWRKAMGGVSRKPKTPISKKRKALHIETIL